MSAIKHSEHCQSDFAGGLCACVCNFTCLGPERNGRQYFRVKRGTVKVFILKHFKGGGREREM